MSHQRQPRTTRRRFSPSRARRPEIGAALDQFEAMACMYQDCFRALYTLAHEKLGTMATDHEVGSLIGQWVGQAAHEIHETDWKPSNDLLDASDEAADVTLATKCLCEKCVSERASKGEQV